MVVPSLTVAVPLALVVSPGVDHPGDGGTPDGGPGNRRTRPVDLTGPISPVVQRIIQSLDEEGQRGRTGERGGGRLVSPTLLPPGLAYRRENRGESQEGMRRRDRLDDIMDEDQDYGEGMHRRRVSPLPPLERRYREEGYEGREEGTRRREEGATGRRPVDEGREEGTRRREEGTVGRRRSETMDEGRGEGTRGGEEGMMGRRLMDEGREEGTRTRGEGTMGRRRNETMDEGRSFPDGLRRRREEDEGQDYDGSQEGGRRRRRLTFDDEVREYIGDGRTITPVFPLPRHLPRRRELPRYLFPSAPAASPSPPEGDSTSPGVAAMPLGRSGRRMCVLGAACPRRDLDCPHDHS